MADEAENKESFFVTRTSKKFHFLIIFLLLGSIILEGGYYFWTKKERSLKISNPEELFEKGEFSIFGENEDEKTICGEISDINGKILTIGSKKATVEIAEEARFYELGPEEKILPVESDRVFSVAQIVCIGTLENSALADYKAKLLVLTDRPMVLWTTQ